MFRLGLISALVLLTLGFAQTSSPDLADDFSNPSKRWFSGQDDVYEIGYKDGSYFMWVKQRESSAYSWLGGRYRDTRIEVDASKLDSPNDGEWGIICRYSGNTNNSGFYAFLFNHDELYATIYRYDKDRFTELAKADIPRAVAIAPLGKPNRLRADCGGSNLVLFINGTEVLRVQDSTYDIGYLGFVLYSYNTPFSVLFDNFALWQGGLTITSLEPPTAILKP